MIAKCSDILTVRCKPPFQHPIVMPKYGQQPCCSSCSWVLQTTRTKCLQAARGRWTRLIQHCKNENTSVHSTSPGTAHLSAVSCDKILCDTV